MVAAMRKMKDSGASWVGSIPSHWDVGRIDGFYTLRNTKVSDSDYPPLSVTKEGILPQLETAAKTNAHDDRKLVRKGDFAINSRSDRRGSCGISPYDGSVSLINTILAPKGEMDPEYYDWLFHTTQFADEFYKWGHGIVDDLWTTNYQDMKKINIPVPPLAEQHVIAAYLNNQCSDIDALSADIQSEIDTLEDYKRSVITETVTKGLDKTVPMKNSGIEWVGEIPAAWGCKPIRSLFNEVTKKNSQGQVTNALKFTYGEIVPKENFEADDDSYVASTILNYTIVSPGTIMINGLNLNFDFVTQRVGLVKDNGIITSAYMAVEPKDNSYTSKYAMYLFKSYDGCKALHNMGGGVRKILNFNEFKRYYVPFPSRDEQETIVAYLDDKCAEIEAIIAQKQEQLAILADYKKSVIYEYVTGKKEVSYGNI